MEDLRVGVTARVNHGMEPFRAAEREHRRQEVWLGQGLATGERDAAAGLVIENAVTLELQEKFLCRGPCSDPPSRFRDAYLTTLATSRAYLRVVNRFAVPLQCAVLARANAVGAPDTTVLRKHQLRTCILTLGVMTPGTGERTSLEKNGAPNTGPVVQGEPHDVENDPSRNRLRSGIEGTPHSAVAAIFSIQPNCINYPSQQNRNA